MFNEIVIKNAPIKKITFFVFMKEEHLPQSQVSLQEGKTFLYKVFGKLYRQSRTTYLAQRKEIQQNWTKRLKD